jgi:hypothetical protein
MCPAASHLLSILVMSATCASVAATGYAQGSTSTDAATELVRLLEESGLEAVAARHPYERDRFVAALYVPESQLLVVSAKYPVPAVLELRLADRAYRDIYTDLHVTGIREGQFFVEDLGADGLRASRQPGEPFDILYEGAARRTLFDGNWDAQRLTETEYRRRFAAADRRYAELLSALTAAVRSAASAGGAATTANREGGHH